jgi:hypothetical protein
VPAVAAGVGSATAGVLAVAVGVVSATTGVLVVAAGVGSATGGVLAVAVGVVSATTGVLVVAAGVGSATGGVLAAAVGAVSATVGALAVAAVVGACIKSEQQNLACLEPAKRDQWNSCGVGKYCLGYTEAFVQSKPSLTKLIFFLAASSKPTDVADSVLNAMGTPISTACAIDEELENQRNSKKKKPDTKDQQAPDISLAFPCFRAQLAKSLSGTNLLLLRTALEDFLFENKWSVNYPHDFIPYDLPRSANALDSQLAPIVGAFNEDVAMFLRRLQDQAPALFLTKSGEKEIQTYSRGSLQ